MSRTSHSFLRILVMLAALTLTALTAGAQLSAPAKEALLPEAPSFLQAAPATAETATVSGIVTDIRGALVPNATIKLEQKISTAPRETVTDQDGRFAFSAVPAGSYTVLILASGLETFLSEAFTLRPGQRFELPDVALPIATATTSIEVGATSAQVAEQELSLETKQRVLGVLPNFYTSFIYNAAPLNTRQKFKLSLRSTLDPAAFVSVGIVAGIEQAHNTFPDYGDDAASFGKRYGAAFGDEFIGRTLGTALFPAIFHQDPRYFYLGPANSTRARILHAIQSGIIVRGDNGHFQPNYSKILGNASAGAISSLYHPDVNGPGQLALTNALVGIGGAAVNSLLREFVLSHVTTKVPGYAKGKPADIPDAPAQAPVPAAVPAKP